MSSDTLVQKAKKWTTSIPVDWRFVPLKYVCEYNKETLSNDADPNYEFDYIDINSVNLENGICSFERMTFNDAPSRARRVVRTGDVIMSTVRTYLKAIAVVPDHEFPMVASTGFLVARANPDIIPSYLGYALKSHNFVSAIEMQSVGVSYPAINSSEAVLNYVPVPPKQTQAAIVSYLDSRCDFISETISRHRQAIDKLEEYRRAVVVKAVTKGLSSSVSTKDSGVAWIGMIPSSWDVKRIKFVARLGSGGTPSRDHAEYWEGNIPWVTTGDLNGTEVTATLENISQLGLEKSSSKVFSTGTVLVAMYGGAGTIGKCGILGGDFAINQALCAIQCDCGLDPNYLLYQMHAIRPYWMRYAAGTRKDPNISQALIANEKIVVPPYTDQLKIVSELNGICSAVDNAIDRQNQTIKKLEEYRRSLIHAAVTGRIDCTKESL